MCVCVCAAGSALTFNSLVKRARVARQIFAKELDTQSVRRTQLSPTEGPYSAAEAECTPNGMIFMASFQDNK